MATLLKIMSLQLNKCKFIGFVFFLIIIGKASFTQERVVAYQIVSKIIDSHFVKVFKINKGDTIYYNKFNYSIDNFCHRTEPDFSFLKKYFKRKKICRHNFFKAIPYDSDSLIGTLNNISFKSRDLLTADSKTNLVISISKVYFFNNYYILSIFINNTGGYIYFLKKSITGIVILETKGFSGY